MPDFHLLNHEHPLEGRIAESSGTEKEHSCDTRRLEVKGLCEVPPPSCVLTWQWKYTCVVLELFLCKML